MQIITPPIRARIAKIAAMETTSTEIEFAITKLCFDIAEQVMDQQHRSSLQLLSFESVSKLMASKTPDPVGDDRSVIV